MLFTEFLRSSRGGYRSAVSYHGMSRYMPPRITRSITALPIIHSTTRFAQFAVIVLALFCAMPAAIAAESVVIFVDGIAMSATGITAMEILTGPQPVRASNYLEESALPALIRLTTPIQKRILWNGNLTDAQATRTAVNNLEAMICQQRGNHVDLVTHSLGTVIAYTALAELAGIAGTDRKAACESTQISTFVTMGSPLGIEDALPERLGKLSGIAIPPLNKIASARQLRIMGRWLNVYASGDPIGGKIDLPSVVNVSFSLDQSTLNPLAAHSFPYKDADSVRMIADVIIGVHTRLGSTTAGTVSEVTSKEKTAASSQSINRTWFSPELKYGVAINGNQGTVTQSNLPSLKVGDTSLRIKANANNSFEGEHICLDGKFHSMHGTLGSDGRLYLTVPDCTPPTLFLLSAAGPTDGGGSRVVSDIACDMPIEKPGMSGQDAQAALGPARDRDRADAIYYLVKGGKFRIPQCGPELGLALTGATEAHRANAIEALATVVQANLSGEDAAAILGTAKECSETNRADAIYYLAKAKKFKPILSGKELEIILDGTTGAARAKAIQYISEAGT